jgi:hypothetical protein
MNMSYSKKIYWHTLKFGFIRVKVLSNLGNFTRIEILKETGPYKKGEELEVSKKDVVKITECNKYGNRFIKSVS